MGSDTDMTDLSLFFCFQHTFVHASPVAWAVALIHTVELIDVQIVSLQQT